jgi:hypothetical protein
LGKCEFSSRNCRNSVEKFLNLISVASMRITQMRWAAAGPTNKNQPPWS